MTGSANIVRHVYKVSKEKKQYFVYELVEVKNLTKPHIQEQPKLTELIRIEKFRHCSKGYGFDHYLRLRDTSNWKTCEQVTGLFKTDKSNVFYGDRRHIGRNLLIFQYSSNNTLTIDYYNGYCPYSKGGIITPDLLQILSKY